MENMGKVDHSTQKNWILALTYIVIFAWYLSIHAFQDLSLDATQYHLKIWAASYQIIALLGGIIGIRESIKWGGYKSIVGKSVLFFALGLLFQVIGQSYDSYLNVLKGVEIPYPAWGDVGFFGSVIWYILGAFYMLKSVGFSFSLKSFKTKIIAIVIPLAALVGSYMYFLNGYEFDPENKLRMFLDFGYPLGEAVYVSIAILALLTARNFLGGFMKKPIWFIIFALAFQYACEFTFLYQAYNETWYAGGINDWMYFTSYLLMSLSLVQVGKAFYKIRTN